MLICRRLIDDDGVEIMTAGKPGELLLHGPSIFMGYYKNSEATKNAFDGDGFLTTGDVAYIDESSQRWFIKDRKKVCFASRFLTCCVRSIATQVPFRLFMIHRWISVPPFASFMISLS